LKTGEPVDLTGLTGFAENFFFFFKKKLSNDIVLVLKKEYYKLRLLSEVYFLLSSIYAHYVIFCSILPGYYIKILKKDIIKTGLTSVEPLTLEPMSLPVR